jgi:hypothetical protein
MKKLQLYVYGTLLCILSMGMGFPDIIMEKDMPRVAKHKAIKKESAKAGKITSRSEVFCTQGEKPSATRQAQQSSAQTAGCFAPAIVTLKDIYLKLFDKKGNLLLVENIKLEEFLNKNYSSLHLPKGSTFVMFHGNTAYYYIDKAG